MKDDIRRASAVASRGTVANMSSLSSDELLRTPMGAEGIVEAEVGPQNREDTGGGLNEAAVLAAGKILFRVADGIGPADPGFDAQLHDRKQLRQLLARAKATCRINIPGITVHFLPLSAAELADLKGTYRDERPNFRLLQSCQRAHVPLNDGRWFSVWQDRSAKGQLVVACLRMRRLPGHLAEIAAKREITDDEVAAMVVAGTFSRDPKEKRPDKVNKVSPKDWIMVPSMVTFVPRDDATAALDGGLTTTIKYLKPDEKVIVKNSATFCRILTDSFACKRVMAPDMVNHWDVNKWHVRRRFIGTFQDHGSTATRIAKTVLIFAAGVCVGEGKFARGGIGLVTKDTVHYHDPETQERVLAAEKTLAGFPDRPSHEFMRRVGACAQAYRKRNRGYDEQTGSTLPCSNLGGVYSFPLERRGPSTDKFGYVDSIDEVAWKSAEDRGFEEMYEQVYKEMYGEATDAMGELSLEDKEEDKTLAHAGKPDQANSELNKDTRANNDPNRLSEPATKKTSSPPATPNRASLRALLAATQLLTPATLADCTRLVIATPNTHIASCATTRLAGWLSRGDGTLPFHSAPGNKSKKNKHKVKKEPVEIEDSDLWREFAAAVKDLGYTGVEVAVVVVKEGEGVVVDVGDTDKKEVVVGMPQAVEAARRAADEAVTAAVLGGGREEGRFGRWTGVFV